MLARGFYCWKCSHNFLLGPLLLHFFKWISCLLSFSFFCSLQVVNTLTRLESVSNFTEFVKAFSQFGSEMVELAQLTGDRQADLKDERRRAQMAAARHVLERSTMMLLTSSKVNKRRSLCTLFSCSNFLFVSPHIQYIFITCVLCFWWFLGHASFS